MTATPIVLSPGELAQRGRSFIPVIPDSPLVTLTSEARWYRPRRGPMVPRYLALHTTESPNATVEQSLRYDARRPEQVSATYIVGEQGIGQEVPESHCPYTTPRWNDDTISIEVVGTKTWTADEWRQQRPATLANLDALIYDICTRRSWPLAWLDAEDIYAGRSGISDHRTSNDAARLEDPSRVGAPYDHTDIGPGLTELVLGMLTTQPEETEMLTLWRCTGWWDTWIAETGARVTPKLLARYRAANVPEVVEYDIAKRDEMLRREGRAVATLTPSGEQLPG